MIKVSQIISDCSILKYVGNSDAVITTPIQLSESNTDETALMWANDANIERLNNVKKGVIICSDKFTGYIEGCNYLVVKSPRYTFKEIIQKYFIAKEAPGISDRSSIHPSAKIGNNVSIAPFVVIEEQVTIGNNVNIGANTVIRKKTIIKDNVTIGSNNTIGGVGFGYEKNEAGEYELIPHMGNVVIHEHAEVGNNTCIDRAVLGSTVIGENVKIDNLVHIAHGVEIGKNSLIIAHAMIGGSTKIGENVWFAPAASVLNKKTIGNNVVVGMGAVVIKDAKDNETIVGNPGKALNK